MSTDGQAQKPLQDMPDWPGRTQGVPPPPPASGVEDVSAEQGLITDEWAPEPDAKPGGA